MLRFNLIRVSWRNTTRLGLLSSGETWPKHSAIDKPFAVGNVEFLAFALGPYLLAAFDTNNPPFLWDARPPVEVSAIGRSLAPEVPPKQLGSAHRAPFGQHYIVSEVKAAKAIPVLLLQGIEIKTARNSYTEERLLTVPT